MHVLDLYVPPLAEDADAPSAETRTPKSAGPAHPALTRALDDLAAGLTGAADTAGSLEYASWLRLLRIRSA